MKIKGIRVAFSTGSLFGDNDDVEKGKYKYEIIEDLFRAGSPLPLIRQFEGQDQFKYAISVPLINRRNLTYTSTESVRSTLREFIQSTDMPREHRMSNSIFGQAMMAANYSNIVRRYPENITGVIVLNVPYTSVLEKMLQSSEDDAIQSSLDIVLSNGTTTGFVYMGTTTGEFAHDPELFTDDARKVINNYAHLERIIDSDLSLSTIRCISSFVEEEFNVPDLNLIGDYIRNNSLLKFCEALAEYAKNEPSCKFRVSLDDDEPYYLSVNFRRADSYTLALRNFTHTEVSEMAYRTGLWSRPIPVETIEEAMTVAINDSIPEVIRQISEVVEEDISETTEASRADWESDIGVEADASDEDEDLYDDYEDDEE